MPILSGGAFSAFAHWWRRPHHQRHERFVRRCRLGALVRQIFGRQCRQPTTRTLDRLYMDATSWSKCFMVEVKGDVHVLTRTACTILRDAWQGQKAGREAVGRQDWEGRAILVVVREWCSVWQHGHVALGIRINHVLALTAAGLPSLRLRASERALDGSVGSWRCTKGVSNII